MRLRTILRVSPGAWLTPAMLALIWLYVSQSITFAPRDPYVHGLTARSMNVLGLVVPVFAAAAAWEGGRLSGVGIWALPFVRHRLVVAAWAIAPAFLGGAVVIVAAAAQVLMHEGLLIPDPPVITLALLLLVAHVFAGFYLGTAWPRVVAVPLVMLASFALFVIPRVLEPRWLEHPFGTTLELCCHADEIVSPEVAASIVVMSGGILLAAVLRIVRRPAGWPGRVASLVAVGGAFALAATIARPIPMDPSAARPGEAEDCLDGRHVRVCVWPEHVDELTVLVATADKAVAAWSRFGIETPRLFTEARSTREPDSRPLSVYVDDEPAGVMIDLADAMIPGAPACAEDEPWPARAAAPYLWVWFVITAGLPPDEVRRHTGDDTPVREEYPGARGWPRNLMPVRPLVDRVLASPPREQRRWVEANLAAMGQCSVDPPLRPE